MPITQITLVSSDASGNVGNSTSYQLSRGIRILGGRPLRGVLQQRLEPGVGRHQQHARHLVKDLQTGAITRVSTDASGNQGNSNKRKNKMIERLITIIMVLLAFSIAASGLPLSSISGAGSGAIGFLNLPLIF